MATVTEHMLADFEREAAEAVGRARQKAREILAAALNRADALREEAKREGYAAGALEGRKIALQEEQGRLQRESAEALRTIVRVAEELKKNRHHLATQSRHDMITLAVAVAERIVKRVVSLDEEAIRANLLKAVELTASRGDGITISLHPTDIARIEKFLPDLRGTFREIGNIDLLGDEGVRSGGCRVAALKCVVDADIHTQLDEIERALIGSLGGETGVEK